MYLPHITDAKHASSWVIGPLLARVLTECVSEGVIEYRHVMFVYAINPKPEEDNQNLDIVFAVASERNSMMPEDSDECFLGVFNGTGHGNMGASEAWADLDTFTQRALEIVSDNFKLTTPPRQIPLT